MRAFTGGGRLLAALVLSIGLLTPGRDAHGATAGAAVSGVDYVDPASGLTGCPPWTWLMPTCYDNATLTPSHLSPKALLGQDIAFMQANHLGTFTRVWVSLDQLMVWDAATGYQGYDRQALANLDDAIGQFAAAGMTLDLVLLTNSNQNGFHPEALDGTHGVMRTNYRTAVFDLISHLATQPTHGTVTVMDLTNEAYLSLETYYLNPAHLGVWAHLMPPWPAGNACYVLGNAVCTGGSDGHGCVNSIGHVDNTCIDVNIIEPWLADLYQVAHVADSSVQYTFSDTGRLLTTSTAPYGSQRWWVGMYPADVYDIHAYNGAPWGTPARWATGLTLPRPWFAGEAGCATGDVHCTYNGAVGLAVDQWWLDNLPTDGATSVLVEDRRTVFVYQYSPQGQIPTLTPLGRLLAGPR